MMKYKVGDKVRIRRDLSKDIDYVNDLMISFAGELATITRVYCSEETYDIDIDKGDWVWHDSMFEDVGMNKHVVISVEENRIVALCGNKKGAVRCRPGKDFYAGAKIALERLKEAEKSYGWLVKGVEYYIPSLTHEELYYEYTYVADDWDKRAMERGLVFRTKEEAISCAKKMLTAIKQEG